MTDPNGTSMDVSAGFDYGPTPPPNVFLQWKGTSACFDFHCTCGRHCHADADFAYTVRCPCGLVWEMPFILVPRLVPGETEAHVELFESPGVTPPENVTPDS